MFKKFAVLLTPFVLAPLTSLLTPTAAHAFTRVTDFRDCDFTTFPRHNFTPVRLTLEYNRTNQVRVLKVETDNNQTERIRKLQVWENQNGRRVSQSRAYDYVPPKTYVNQSVTQLERPVPLAWVSPGGNRSATVWLYNANNSVCTVSFPL
ncbi:MAG: hypothetical protein ICV54_19650 [Nostoc sp. C3-bin3]|nr:hypothetical protein [Nostoc sp. C3-bin3]